MKNFNFKLTRRHLIIMIIAAAGLLIISILVFFSVWRAVSTKILSQAEPSRVDTSTPVEMTAGIIPLQEIAITDGQIDEGIEDNFMPPTGWIVASTNPTYTWKIGTIGNPFTGTHFADVEYDPDLNDQDEFLLSPSFWGDTGSVSFWSGGSIDWCKDTHDNCDLEVWFLGPQPGAGDDVLLGKSDDSWTDNWVWAQSTFDFSPYLNGWGRIGFRYVGNDGAQVKLDQISISYAGSPSTYLPLIVDINSLSE